MPLYLRQSTASQEVPLGYFVAATDGDTEKTGLTIANTDIKVWKTGATTLASKNSGGATHISNGIYYAVLDATDTDTIGPLVLFVHVSTALAVRVECCVLDEAVYDVMFGTTAPATATNITAAAGCAVSSLGSGVINAASIAADTGLSVVRSNTCQNGGTPTTAVLDASASSVDSFYNGDIITFTGGVGDGYSRVITAYSQAAKTVTFAPAIPSGPDNTTTFVIRRQSQVGGVQGNVTGNITGSLGSLASGAITSGTIATGAITTSAFAAGAIDSLAIADNAITAAKIASDAITDAKVAADVTIASVTGSVGSVTGAVGSVTGNVGGNVTGSVGSVVGAVGSVTGNVGGNVTGSVGSVVGAVGSVTGNVGGNVVGSVGSVTGLTASNLDVTVSSRLAAAAYTTPPTAADVANAVAVLAASEVSAVPGATPAWIQALQFLYQALRNQVLVTATTKKVYTDAGVLVGTKALSDDGSTLTEGKMS